MKYLVPALTLAAVCSATLTTARAALYVDVITADNPVGYWRLGESVNTDPADNLGSSDDAGDQDGTYSGGVTVGQTALIHSTVSGGDTAAAFDGVNDWVNIAADTTDLNSSKSAYTVEARFRATDTNSVQYLYVQGGGTDGVVRISTATPCAVA